MPRGRRDANESEIVRVYELMGFDVFRLEDRDKAGLLDLLVIGMMPCPECQHRIEQARLVEVKTETGRIRKEQVKVLDRHPVAARLARNLIGAINAVGQQGTVIARESRHTAQTVRP